MVKKIKGKGTDDPRFTKMQEMIKEGRYDVFSASMAAGYSRETANKHSRLPDLVQLADQSFAKLCSNARQAAVSTAYEMLRTSKSEITKGKMAALLMKETGLKELIVPKNAGGSVDKLNMDQLRALSAQLGLIIQQGNRDEKVIEHMPDIEEDDFGLLS